MVLTLVIPVFNSEHTLDALFASILNQKRCFDQVIFVDNGSRDGSARKLLAFQSEHPEAEIVLLREEIQGPGTARNRALQTCIGDVVAFTDSDCCLHDGWAEHIAEFFETNPEAGLLGGVELGYPPKTVAERFSTLVLLTRPQNGPRDLTTKLEWFSGHLVSTLNFAVRRSVLLALGGFARWPAGEDIDFWMRALERGFRVRAHDPKMLVWHRQRASLGRFLAQQWGYALAVPQLFKRHFHGMFLIATSRKQLLRAPVLTALIAINPHTILLLLLVTLGYKALVVYLVFLALKPVQFFRRSRGVGMPLTAWQCVSITVPDEILRWVVSVASLVGSLRHRVLCVR